MELNNLFVILMLDDITKSLNSNLDYILKIIPELQHTINFDQKHPHHHLDVWNHTLLALKIAEDNFDKDFDVRLCLLLHDIGKPFSYQAGEVRHFKGHPKKSSETARGILERLKCDSKYIDYICELIEKHDTPITDDDIMNRPEFVNKLYKIQYSDALAHHPNHLEKRKIYLDEVGKKLK